MKFSATFCFCEHQFSFLLQMGQELLLSGVPCSQQTPPGGSGLVDQADLVSSLIKPWRFNQRIEFHRVGIVMPVSRSISGIAAPGDSHRWLIAFLSIEIASIAKYTFSRSCDESVEKITVCLVFGKGELHIIMKKKHVTISSLVIFQYAQ
jgi:hypothetical protein